MNIIEQLKEYDNLYFETGTSPVSDTEYDKLKTEAKKQFPNDPYFNQVGFKTTYKTIKLPFIMGGLDKVDRETVQDWIKDQKRRIVASEKLDGNSIGCIWKDGTLNFAAQRGTDEEGSDILEKAKFFVPRIPVTGIVKLRGEVLLEGDLYKHFNFKNRRNGVAGLLRRDDVKPSDLQLLSVIFYEVIESPENTKNEIERLEYIEEICKLRVPRYHILNSDSKNIEDQLTTLLKEYKETADYDIDGLVLTFNDAERENVKFPKNKKKFKVNEEAVKCRVIDIEWQVTRTGLIKPVIIIEPTEIMGVTVQRCSGFNLEFMQVNGIGIDSLIGVVRSGDVIPYVTEVFERAERVTYPHLCPSCKRHTIIKSKELICDNNQCITKSIYEVGHFFMTLEADGISNKTFENLKITSVEDAYELTVDDIKDLPGFGKKSAEKIVTEIKKTLKTKPYKLLAAFGIPMIGRTLSKQLMNKYTLDELFNIKDVDELGLGPITSKSLIDNIGNYKELYEFLKEKGLEFEKEDMTNQLLKGKIFALTGEGPLKRSDLQKMIEARGGTVKGISKTTDYLVANDTETKTGKVKAAFENGTTIIDYNLLMMWLK